MHRPLLLLTLVTAALHAGMPSVTLTDVGRFRLESLSFFLVLLLLLSVVVWRLWNRLSVDFPRLPKLRYRAALGLMCLWGLLVLVVLTMISGARELLSPKAWVKTGLTYQLASEVGVEAGVRRAAIEDLRDALWRWRDAHGGQLPAHEFGEELPARRWLLPGSATLRYHYAPQALGSTRPLAWEPAQVAEPRLMLRGDGTVESLSTDALKDELKAVAP